MTLSSLSGTNLEHAKDHNLRVTLQAIRLHGPVSRAELAGLTGLTPQTIAYISKKLLSQNLILETGRRRGGRGQPATEIVINPEGGYSVGVNIDRDHLTVILMDLAGEIRAREHLEKNFVLPDEAFSWVDGAFHRLLQATGLTRNKLAGVGLAIPFKLGYRRLAMTPPAYAAWRDYPSKARLEDIVGSPVYEENDATAAAIGESQYGHGTSIHSFFYLYFAYGLGGGLVVDGGCVSGAAGRGGEIGHIPLEARSAMGKRPMNLQDRVSLATLYTYLEEAGIAIADPDHLLEVFKSRPDEITAWLNGAAEDLIPALTALTCVVNPAAILIGGRLPDPLIDSLIDALGQRFTVIRSALPDMPTILRAMCSPDAAALGAAIIPFARVLFPAREALMKQAG